MIGGADSCAALECQRRDVGIRCEIASRASRFQKTAEDRPVVLTRPDRLDTRLP
jgi:hypothetical protein